MPAGESRWAADVTMGRGAISSRAGAGVWAGAVAQGERSAAHVSSIGWHVDSSGWHVPQPEERADGAAVSQGGGGILRPKRGGRAAAAQPGRWGAVGSRCLTVSAEADGRGSGSTRGAHGPVPRPSTGGRWGRGRSSAETRCAQRSLSSNVSACSTCAAMTCSAWSDRLDDGRSYDQCIRHDYCYCSTRPSYIRVQGWSSQDVLRAYGGEQIATSKHLR